MLNVLQSHARDFVYTDLILSTVRVENVFGSFVRDPCEKHFIIVPKRDRAKGIS